jgi:hypothetical protein
LHVLFKYLVTTLGTALAAAVLAAACTNPSDDNSTSPVVVQDVVTPEVRALESDEVSDEGVFLRLVAPLDEAREATVWIFQAIWRACG